MKHNWKVICILLGMFLVSQFIGLWISGQYLQGLELPLGMAPIEIETGFQLIPFLLTMILILVGAYFIFKHEYVSLWKIWFFFAVFLALTIAFTPMVGQYIAIGIALVLAIGRLFSRYALLHNFTELFLYGGLISIFVTLDIVTPLTVIGFLFLISIYDYIAVYKTKHMVQMAKFQGKQNLFSGFAVPYENSLAILGGGDIGFSLLFAATIMKYHGLTVFSPLLWVVPFFTLLSLLYLFYIGKKKKFYPAMPYLSTGMFVGYAVFILLSYI